MGTKRKARKAEAASRTSSSSDHTDDYSGGGGWSSLPWKSLTSATAGDTNVITAGDNDGDDGKEVMFDEQDVGYNHYDDPDAADWSELYADPATTAGGKKRGDGSRGRDRSSEADGIEGADDPGILLGLEVVDGSLYEVRREKVREGGAVTRVVATVNAGPSESSAVAPAKTSNKKKRKSNVDSDSNNDNDGSGDDDKAALADIQKEIRRLKKKAKRKKAKLRKQEMRKKQLDEKDTAANNESDKAEKSANEEEPDSTAEPTEQDINTIRTSWSVAAPGVYLHDVLCRGLALQGFAVPTPIQASTLPASIMGRRDIVGAAQTGSGKTLAYALPMLQGILAARDSQSAAGEIEPLTGLVLCPTRELVVQVTSEIKAVGCMSVEVGTIVGGLAEQKQKRVLDVKRPPILVATPGRLWELMSSNDHPHLNDLTNLRYLIIDEVDRMIRQGSFPQLTKIFDMINKANPPPEEEETSDDDDDDDDPDRLRSLPGVRGEARVTMLDDTLLAMIRKQEGGGSLSDEDKPPPAPQETNDDDFREQLRQQERQQQQQQQQQKLKVNGSFHRQTFVYSATLTLPPSSHHSLKSAASSLPYKKRKKRTHQTVDGAIAEMMDRAGARGQMKVVDLTSSEDAASSKRVSGPVSSQDAKAKPQRIQRLPPGLSLYQAKCTQLHKDMYLYAYLTTTKIGSSGPCLVFCNSVAAVRRIGETLKTLRLPVRTLHAQMAQKARMSALEWINKPESRSIVVATDVAARGLDIPSVATVVHYDVPRAIDTFIHRSGRTARGVGAKAVGSSISLVSPGEEKAHRAICEALHGSVSRGFEVIPMDGRLLSAAQERTNLAARIVECENIETKAHKNNRWFIEAAEDAGFDLDEDLLDGGLMDGTHRDRQKLSEARKARQTLNELLAAPMRTQQFGKFLSGAGLKAAIQAENDVSPYIVQDSTTGGKGSKNKKRKRQKFSRK